MDQSTIQSLASAIADASFLHNWSFYVLMAAIVLLNGVVTALATSYYSERGRNLATKADFQDLLSHLRTNTHAVETIRADIQRNDWSWRELQTLRRTKLEEMITTLHASSDWLSAEATAKVFGGAANPNTEPATRGRMLGALYFPELMKGVERFGQCFMNCATEINNQGTKLTIARAQSKDTSKMMPSVVDIIHGAHVEVVNAISVVEKDAQRLMEEILAVRENSAVSKAQVSEHH